MFVGVVLLTRNVGLTEVIAGTGGTVKLLLEFAVFPLTVTEIRPVVAVAGTVATNVVVLAETTVATAPLNFTVF